MNKYSFELAEFNNIGFITTQLSDEQLKPLRDEVDEIIKNNFNGSKKPIYNWLEILNMSMNYQNL